MQRSIRQTMVLLVGLTVAAFSLLGLAACAVQPVQRSEPNVLSRIDDLVMADIKDVDVSALFTDTLVIMPYEDFTKAGPKFDFDPTIINAAAIVRLGALKETPVNAAVFVSPKEIASTTSSVGDLQVNEILNLPYDTVGVVRAQPGFEWPTEPDTPPAVTIPLEILLGPGATPPLPPLEGVCLVCSGEWWCCMLGLPCCGF